MRRDEPADCGAEAYTDAQERLVSEEYAPTDITDGREPYEWRTRWRDPQTQKKIGREARYLGWHLGRPYREAPAGMSCSALVRTNLATNPTTHKGNRDGRTKALRP